MRHYECDSCKACEFRRGLFTTGITKLSNTSIFSAFNNLQDISLDPFYGALLGYTEDEISKYFSSYIAQAAKALLVSPDKVRSELKELLRRLFI